MTEIHRIPTSQSELGPYTCQLVAIRSLLETHAAGEAAVYATDHSTLRTLTRLAASHDPAEGRRFHVVLAAAAGNHPLAEMLGELLDRLASVAGDHAVCGEPATAPTVHRALLDAVLGGRRSQAIDIARAHVHASRVVFFDGLAVADDPIAVGGP